MKDSAAIAKTTAEPTEADELPVLSLRDIRKRYGSAVAVEGVTVDILPGEFLTLLGPSGSGKTTTLNIVAGFTDATHGDLLMDGNPISNLPTHKRNIGVVFQHYALFPHLNIEQNVAFPLRRRKVPKQQRDAMVAEALDMVKLGDLGKRYPRELSGGQQQRVALARALVFRPRVLLMDEPLGALDKKLREWLQSEIKRIHHELGITFIYVTHDQEEALVLSDRIAVFNNGLVEQLGTPEELYQHPKTLFVAEFLGESNVFSGVAVEADGCWYLECDGHRFFAPEPASPLPSGSRGSIVVRPERMTLTRSSDGPAGQENVLDGTVVNVEYLGGSRRVTVALANGHRAAVREAAGVAQPLREGEGVHLSWSCGHSTLLPHADVDVEAELREM